MRIHRHYVIWAALAAGPVAAHAAAGSNDCTAQSRPGHVVGTFAGGSAGERVAEYLELHARAVEEGSLSLAPAPVSPRRAN